MQPVQPNHTPVKNYQPVKNLEGKDTQSEPKDEYKGTLTGPQKVILDYMRLQGWADELRGQQRARRDALKSLSPVLKDRKITDEEKAALKDVDKTLINALEDGAISVDEGRDLISKGYPDYYVEVLRDGIVSAPEAADLVDGDLRASETRTLPVMQQTLRMTSAESDDLARCGQTFGLALRDSKVDGQERAKLARWFVGPMLDGIVDGVIDDGEFKTLTEQGFSPYTLRFLRWMLEVAKTPAGDAPEGVKQYRWIG